MAEKRPEKEDGNLQDAFSSFEAFALIQSWTTSTFYLSTYFLSHILDSFVTSFPPFNVAWRKWSENSVQDWKWTSLCKAHGEGGCDGCWSLLFAAANPLNNTDFQLYLYFCSFWMVILFSKTVNTYVTLRQKNQIWSSKVWVISKFLSSLLAACLSYCLQNARNAVSENLIFKISRGGGACPSGIRRSFGPSPRCIPIPRRILPTGLYAQHWSGRRGGGGAPAVPKMCLNWDKSKCSNVICPWLLLPGNVLDFFSWRSVLFLYLLWDWSAKINWQGHFTLIRNVIVEK